MLTFGGRLPCVHPCLCGAKGAELSIVRTCLLLSLLAFATSPALADSEGPRFGIVNWFPFGWVEDGQPQGMFVDMAAAIDRALGLEERIVIAPVPRVFRSMQEGEFDFTISYRDQVMMSEVEYLSDIGCLRSLIVSRQTRPALKLDDLNGMRVAYPGGGYFVARFLPDLELDGVEVARTDIMFRMMLRGRLDAFVINDAIWQSYRADLNPDFSVPSGRWNEFAEPYILETMPLAISMSKATAHRELGERIKSLMQSPAFRQELQSIYNKYQLPHGLACINQTDIVEQSDDR